MKINSLPILLFVVLGCSKKNTTSPTGNAIVSFNYSDNKRSNFHADSIGGGRLFAQSGGNDVNDTTHGYVFSAAGGNGSAVFITFEIPKLASGTFIYKAFSPSWPHPLGLDSWKFPDGTFLDPDSAHITFNLSRYSNGTSDGSFSVDLINGSFYAHVSGGSFANIPTN